MGCRRIGIGFGSELKLGFKFKFEFGASLKVETTSDRFRDWSLSNSAAAADSSISAAF